MNFGVVLIHLGRCGSTVLGDLLGQHSAITWRGEIFEPMMQSARARQGRNYRIQEDPVELALRALSDAETQLVGIEVKPFHFDAFGIPAVTFIDGLRKAGLRHFIVLDRRNRLRKIVSSRIAAQTGVWHVPANATRKAQRLNLVVENVDMDGRQLPLKQLLEYYDLAFAEVRRLLSPEYLELLYETDIQEDPSKAYHRVIDYLGLAQESVKIKLGRTNASPLNELLENFTQVATHLDGTMYEWMLRD